MKGRSGFPATTDEGGCGQSAALIRRLAEVPAGRVIGLSR